MKKKFQDPNEIKMKFILRVNFNSETRCRMNTNGNDRRTKVILCLNNLEKLERMNIKMSQESLFGD